MQHVDDIVAAAHVSQFVHQDQFDLLAVAINLDDFLVRFAIARAPVGELLLATGERFETRIAGRSAFGFDAANDMERGRV